MVIPSLPGYGFSGKPATTGLEPLSASLRPVISTDEATRILGATSPRAATGGRGYREIPGAMAPVPEGLIAIHTNFAHRVPLEVLESHPLRARGPPARSSRRTNSVPTSRSTFSTTPRLRFA